MRISIDGIIGCGKSTQIKRIMGGWWLEDFHHQEGNHPGVGDTTRLLPVKTYPEEVDDWVNEGWVESFYHDPCRNCLGFQLRVLLSHSRVQSEGISITERSPFSSTMIFGEMALEDRTLNQMEFDLNVNYYKKIGWIPDHIIYLDCSPDLAFRRVQERNREGEDHLTPCFLKKLSKKYVEKLGMVGVPVHVVDASREEDEVTAEIKKIISECLSSGNSG